jgi:hypothetical protein
VSTCFCHTSKREHRTRKITVVGDSTYYKANEKAGGNHQTTWMDGRCAAGGPGVASHKQDEARRGRVSNFLMKYHFGHSRLRQP